MYRFKEKITVNDLDSGISWILENYINNKKRNYQFENLEDLIINLTWVNFKFLKNKDLFAKVILLRMKEYQTIFPPSKKNISFDSIDNEIKKHCVFRTN